MTRVTGAMCTTPKGGEALTCISPLDLAVRGKARSALHRLWSQMLVLPSPQSRAQQHIDAALEIGSPNFIRGSML